jgi:hypothetical protein
MFFKIKNIAKRMLYTFSPKRQLKSHNIKLGYIFHTERLYDDQIFNRLILFCQKYKVITGVEPICAVIPPSNLLLKQDMRANNFSESDYTSRIIELSNHSTIGYHGHFYLENNPVYYNAIHCNNFKVENLRTQFENDIQWFEKNQIAHNNIYTAGWWFFNEDLLQLLLQHGFQFDFSFSRAPFFYNQFSNEVMNENNIPTGEVFEISVDGKKKLTCIQNFIGMHTTNFPEDFDRNMKRLNLTTKELVGVVNSHDYDLHFENTLKCIEFQIKYNKITFLSFNDLIANKPAKSIQLHTTS